MGIVQDYFKEELKLKAFEEMTEEECIVELIDSHRFLRIRNLHFTKFLQTLEEKWYLRWVLWYLPKKDNRIYF